MRNPDDGAGRDDAPARALDDLTRERDALRAALERSEQRFRRLAESLPQFIWESDEAGELHYVNQRWLDYSGVSFADSRNVDRLSAAFHPADAPRIAEAWADALKGLRRMEVEGRLRSRNGDYRWFLMRAEPVIEHGAAVRWFGTSTDITELKETQARERALAEHLRRRLDEQETLLQALPVGVFIAHDAACTHITLNPAGAAMLRIPLGRNASKTGPEAASLPFRALQHGVELRNEDLPMQRAARLGVTVAAEELDLLFDDGALITLYEHARPLFDEHGAVRGCVGVFVDITEHKRTQDALREASRRKDEFLATLAHELRNPLAALAAAAQLLAKAPERPAVATTARDAVQRQIDHMSRLLDDLLDVSRITHGLVQLRVEHVNLVEAVEAAVETARTQIAARSHSLQVSAPREPVYVHGDRGRLTQIAWNLLSNAAKYTDAGGVIEVIVRAEADAAILIVRDNGIGIAPEMLGRVFEMFSQATPALHRSEGGLGIGLSLVRGLVRLHGGEVEARSSGPRQGSEFVVRLPLIAPSKGAMREASFAARHKAPGRALRILVADDNADSATSWAMLLQLAGHDVRVAHDGREALALAEQLRPHLALLDIGMPGVNGYEVARAIRAAPWGAGIKLVAITGWGQEHDKAEAHAAGFDHHYTKPVELSTLDPLLAELAARSP